MIRRFAAHRDQPLERDPRQRLSRGRPPLAAALRGHPPEGARRARRSGGRLPCRPQVAPDQPGIRLADFDERLTRLIVRNGDDVEALVGNALAEYREVNHWYRSFIANIANIANIAKIAKIAKI